MTGSIRRPLAAAAAALLMAAARNAWAARLPEWAEPIAENAPPLEQDYDDPTRVLYEEIHVGLDKDGELSTRWRIATQVLGSQVSRIKTQAFVFREGSHLRLWRGWHVPAGEKAQKSRGGALEIAAERSFLDDLRARFVHVGGISRGSIVFFESEVEEEPIELSFQHLFGNETETLVERFELELPSSGWTVRSAWLRREGPAPVTEGNLWRWEMKGLAALKDDPLGVRAQDTAPLLSVGLVPPTGFRTKAAVFTDWQAVSSWSEGVAKGRDAVSPEIEAAAKKALGSAPRGFFDTVRTLSRFVRDSVRYVDKEVGVGNYQPRPAGQVLAQLYGDCKDKATLLRSMLKVAGIQSYHGHINATAAETFSETVPSWAWNHAIVAVAVPDGTDAPASFAPAMADGGSLGRLLFVDPTDPYAAIGTVPSRLLGKRVLVDAGSRSRLLTVPTGEPSQHCVDRRFVTRVQPDGSLAIETTWRYSGAAAEWARTASKTSYSDRRRAVEDQFLSLFVHGEPKSYEVEAETPDGFYTETMSWRVPRPEGRLKEVPLFIGAADSLPRTAVGSKRRTPITYGHPLTLVYEARIEGVPATAILPQAARIEEDGWSIATSCDHDGEAIRARWEMVLSKPRFEVESFGELKKLWRSIASTGSAAVHLDEGKSP